jgi:hypothetical protein
MAEKVCSLPRGFTQSLCPAGFGIKDFRVFANCFANTDVEGQRSSITTRKKGFKLEIDERKHLIAVDLTL